jgi:hypothetical protein
LQRRTRLVIGFASMARPAGPASFKAESATKVAERSEPRELLLKRFHHALIGESPKLTPREPACVMLR